MREIESIRKVIVDEMDKIAEKGLNTGNLETAFKLIDMYKDLVNTQYWDAKCDYYMTVIDEMRNGGSSYAMEHDYSGRHRDSRGRYSRNDGYDRGSSYARRGEHYVRGHYSRADGGDHYDEYMDNKHSYRNGEKSEDCKRRMIDALERHMDALTDEVGELARDSDCIEEKKVIERYIDKLKRMM